MNEYQKSPDTPKEPTTVAAPIEKAHLEKQPNDWRAIILLLGVLQIVEIALFFVMLFPGNHQIKTVPTGTLRILFMAFIPTIMLLALVNAVTLAAYLSKYKPRGAALTLCILSLFVSANAIFTFGVYGTELVSSAAPREKKNSSALQQQQLMQHNRFAAENAKPEITESEATKLLQTCKVQNFRYTNQTETKTIDGVRFPSAETSTTGIVLIKMDDASSTIAIADRLVAGFVPIARAAQKTCGSVPQFWHDGTDERYSDGRWYFRDQLVNTTVLYGSTKDEAMSFMQSCKADYFMGYTDMNLVKRADIKAYLREAETSTTGIEIIENSPQSYVFASKAMTAELQDAAVASRKTCVSQKKLFIMIDDWIEAQNPATGSWERVKQPIAQ